MHRGRIAAGLLALATCFAFAAVTNSAAFAGSENIPAAAPLRAAAPVTSTDTADGRTLAADNAINLTESGATVQVVGAGFDPATDVYLAICNTAATAQNPLADCLGGPVPAANPTKAWAWVSSTDSRPNRVAWTDDGFTASLVINSPDGIGPVCGDNQCVIIARTDGDAATRAADITIPVTFTGDDPTTSTTTTTTTTTTTSTSTSTSEQPTAPLTVGPQSVVSPEIAVGGVQTIVFAEFQAGEQVTVGLFPGPIELPPALASDVGVVTISFTITSDMSPGLHTVQAVGVNSGTVGIAEFTVATPPPVTSETTTSTSSVASSTQTTTSAPVTTETTTSTEASTATTTTTTDAAPIATDGESSSLWWLWVTIVVVVLVGGVTAAVAMSRRRAAQLAEEEEAKEAELAEAAEREAQNRAAERAATPEPPAAYDYSDDFGLLSGREHADGPALYSGQGGYTPEARTERIQNPEQHGLSKPRVEPPTARIEPPTTRIPAPGAPNTGAPTGAPTPAPQPDTSASGTPDSGPSTAQWRPDFDEGTPPADPGPSTAQWRPNFEEEPVSDSPAEGGPATQAWQPPPVDPDDQPTGRHS